MHRYLARNALAISACLCVLFSGPADCAQGLPRYKLEPGQVLSYRLVMPQVEWNDGKGGKITERGTTLQWTIYVVRKNENGGWRLFFANRWSREEPGSFEINSDGYFELTPDGGLSNTTTVSLGIQDVTLLFPPLPRDEDSLAGTWRTTSPVDGTVRTLRTLAVSASSPGETCHFREVADSLFNSVLERSEQREFEFDLERGLIRGGTIAVEQKLPGLTGSTRMSIELTETRRLDSEQAATFDRDIEMYVSADQQYRTLVERAQRHDVRNASGLLDEAESILRQLPPRLKSSLVTAVVQTRLESCAQDRERYLRNASDVAGMVDLPAPDWRTTDLDGNPRAMTDYRGKVVVLDFWHRGCGWCMRCMPQIDELVNEFKERNVVFLAMSSDENEEDARFVIEKARLSYPTLKDDNQQIRKDFRGPSTYPTMIIVDAEGIVRHAHIGYSRDLRQEVSRVINELLAGPRKDSAAR